MSWSKPTSTLKIEKVRHIKTTQNTDRGRLFSKKNRNDGFVEFESLGEENLFILLDHDPNCICIESQPLKIPNPKGKSYIPDGYAEFRDGKRCIFDVKHTKFFESLRKHPKKFQNWEYRKKTVQNFCNLHALDYHINTDNTL